MAIQSLASVQTSYFTLVRADRKRFTRGDDAQLPWGVASNGHLMVALAVPSDNKHKRLAVMAPVDVFTGDDAGDADLVVGRNANFEVTKADLAALKKLLSAWISRGRKLHGDAEISVGMTQVQTLGTFVYSGMDTDAAMERAARCDEPLKARAAALAFLAGETTRDSLDAFTMTLSTS
jgi:hypothetical protein